MRHDLLVALDVLDTPADPDFDRLTRLAAGLFTAPMALIALLDTDRQWFKSSVGIAVRETPISMSFCARAPGGSQPLVVLDASRDALFADNPLVTGDEHIRFYAGAPIVVRDVPIGSLCVLDREPRDVVEPQLLDQLVDLAATVAALFELKDEARVRAHMAADLLREEWRHALTLEAGKVGSWVWDLPSGDVAANDIFRRMFGLDPQAPIRIADLMGAVRAEDVPAVNAALETSFSTGVDYVSEFRVHSGRWLAGRGRVYQRDGEGKPLVMMGVNIDVTETREAADHTRHLLRELNHRVKNTLAMIQSLARQTIRRSPDPQSFLDAFSGRLQTLSEAHTLLSQRDWSSIGLVELIRREVDGLAPPAQDQLVLIGTDVPLPPDHALGLALVLHELASNARRFGALSRPDGRVTISWTADDASPRRLELLWRESGGPPVAVPTESGFGSRLIQRSLDKILDSSVRLEFPASGAEARISLPLS